MKGGGCAPFFNNLNEDAGASLDFRTFSSGNALTGCFQILFLVLEKMKSLCSWKVYFYHQLPHIKSKNLNRRDFRCPDTIQPNDDNMAFQNVEFALSSSNNTERRSILIKMGSIYIKSLIKFKTALLFFFPISN